jgi:hypothetical protein
MAKAFDLPLQAIATGTSLVAEPQLPPLDGETSDELGDDLSPVRKYPELPDLTVSAVLRHRH